MGICGVELRHGAAPAELSRDLPIFLSHFDHMVPLAPLGARKRTKWCRPNEHVPEEAHFGQ